MKTKTQTKDRPRQKAQAEPGAVRPATGKIKPQTETPRRKRTGGGELLKTRREMAQAAGFSVRTLDRLVKARLVPVVVIGKLRFFRPDAVMAALQKNCELREVEA